MTTPTAIDPGTFREVLGHFPTGVVVITALDPDGAPVGMVIGSFTSVSLDPPLVAFLPARSSRTYARMAAASSFCVNVLAADQGALCRQFGGAEADPFETVGWHQAPSGAPILDGVVAWIDCQLERVVDGGDHHVVFGRVEALNVEAPVLPLLFFQGGFGRFAPASMVMPTVPHLLEAARLADRFAPRLDQIARTLGAECSLVVPDGADVVFIAGANHSMASGWTRLGARFPLMAPLAPLLVEHQDAAEADWLNRRGRLDAEATAHARRQLDLARDRGWSLLLRGPEGADVLEEVVAAYSTEHRTPSQERRLASVVVEHSVLHEPERLEPESAYDVVQLSVPVVDESGRTIALLRLSALPERASTTQIAQWVEVLREAAGAA